MAYCSHNRRSLLILFAALAGLGCNREPLPKSKVLDNLRPTQDTLLADGKAMDTLYATIMDVNSDVSRRNVKFIASAGRFLGSKDSAISVRAEWANNELVARAILQAPLVEGTIGISAQPDVADLQQDYTQRTTIIAKRSEPATIHLEPSAFGIKTNFGSEVKLVAVVNNARGGPVSAGYRVRFMDYLSSGDSAIGYFRAASLTTDSTSSGSVLYSVGTMPPVGTQILIKATLDSYQGQSFSIADTIKITVQ